MYDKSGLLAQQIIVFVLTFIFVWIILIFFLYILVHAMIYIKEIDRRKSYVTYEKYYDSRTHQLIGTGNYKVHYHS